MKEKAKEEDLELPDKITPATMGVPRDLVIISIPKAGRELFLENLQKNMKMLLY